MKNEFENRKIFLEYIKNDLQGSNLENVFYLLEKAIKTQNKQLLSYENIISMGVNKTNEKYNSDEFCSLLRKLYTYWWNNALHQKYILSNERSDLAKFIQNEDYNPNNQNNKNIIENLNFIQDFSFAGIMSPIHFQEKHFCHFYVNNLSLDRKKLDKPIETRLYLNIKSKNIMQLADKLIDNALKLNTPLLFKVALKNGRNDNFVLYTNYEDIYSLINLIELTKQENIELFDGCNIKNPFMAKIKGYIGYGDEPFVWGSFNSVRVEILQKCYDILTKKHKNDISNITKNEIIELFEKVCGKYQVDKNNFYLNSEERDYSNIEELINN